MIDANDTQQDKLIVGTFNMAHLHAVCLRSEIRIQSSLIAFARTLSKNVFLKTHDYGTTISATRKG
jgi:hypothetical protein